MEQPAKVSSSKRYLSRGCEERNIPTSSFSFWRYLKLSSSWTGCGISGLVGFISSISPKREMAESILSLRYSSPYLSKASMNSSPFLQGVKNWLLEILKLSKAPEYARDSRALRLTIPLILSIKSNMSANVPLLSLSAIMAWTILSPKPFMPPNPK